MIINIYDIYIYNIYDIYIYIKNDNGNINKNNELKNNNL